MKTAPDSKKILIIEKNPEYLSLIESRLQVRGYNVDSACTSLDGLKKIDAEKYQLILVSARMEPVHEQDLCEIARKKILNRYTPIILMAEPEDLGLLISGMELGFDDFLIKPFDPLILQLRVMMAIKRSAERIEANPLTYLPGNHTIQKVVQKKIQEGRLFSVCYLDINHFKSFNDAYGFSRADDVICHVARTISETCQKHTDGDYFVGHIGGDDFIAIMSPDYEEEFAKACMRELDKIFSAYYSEEDREKGYLLVKNRKGSDERFPLMSICIAVVTNLYRPFTNYRDMAHTAAEVKKFLKTQPGSSYLRDRREQQFTFLEEAASSLLLPEGSNQPLGQVLLAAGLITAEQLEAALKQHLATGKRLGQILIEMNLVSMANIGKMLEAKLKIPYISLAGQSVPQDVLRLLPVDFVKEHRVILLQYVDDKLKAGMIDPFALKTIDEIERITGCSVIPALILEDEFQEFFQRHYSLV